MEITILSAEGLKSTSFGPFSHRLRPFVTITTYPPTTPCNGDEKCQVYSTRIDDQGGVNPTWGDRFRVPVDASFLANRYSTLYIQLYTKRLILGHQFLGWCQVPVADFGFPLDGSVRHLSYRMRARDGTRGHGIVNLAVKVTAAAGFQPVARQRLLDSNKKSSKTSGTVIGIPVTVFPHWSICQ